MRYETNVANGVTHIEFDRKDIEMNKMGVTTLESKFRIFDMRTQHPTVGRHSLFLRSPLTSSAGRLLLSQREGPQGHGLANPPPAAESRPVHDGRRERRA